VISAPKPMPRALAPRQFIARVSSRRKAKRLTMSQKKALHPERYCAKNRCYTPPKHIGRCTTHAKEHLDALMRSIVVTSDECEAAAWHKDLFACGGPIQVNHGVERERLLTRWRLDNVLAGCQSLNVWAFHHRREWDRMLKDWWGVEKFNELEDLALSGAKPDYEAAEAALREAQ
jgi:hypothetical protein